MELVFKTNSQFLFISTIIGAANSAANEDPSPLRLSRGFPGRHRHCLVLVTPRLSPRFYYAACVPLPNKHSVPGQV